MFCPRPLRHPIPVGQVFHPGPLGQPIPLGQNAVPDPWGIPYPCDIGRIGVLHREVQALVSTLCLLNFKEPGFI
eukprot:5143021-Alexandrium_andersonii.AAC.1